MTAQPETDRRNPGQWLRLRRGDTALVLSPDVVDRTEAYQKPAPVPFAPAGVVGIVVTEDGEPCTVLDPAAFGGVIADGARNDGWGPSPTVGSPACSPARFMVRLITAHGPVVVLCDQLVFDDGDEAPGLAVIERILAPLAPAAARGGVVASAAPESHSDYLIIGRGGRGGRGCGLAAVPAANVVAVDHPRGIRQSRRNGELVAEVGGRLLPCRSLDEGVGNLAEGDGKVWALTVDDAGVRRVLLTARVEGLHRASSGDVLTVDHGTDRTPRYSRWVRHPRFGLVEIVAATGDGEIDGESVPALSGETEWGPSAVPDVTPLMEAVPQAAFSLRVGDIIIAVPADMAAGALRADEIVQASGRGTSGAGDGALFDLAAALGSLGPEARSDRSNRGGGRPGVLIPMGKRRAVVRVDEVRLSSSGVRWCPLPVLPMAAAAIFAAVRLSDGRVEYLLKSLPDDFRFHLPALRQALRRGFVGRAALPLPPDGNHPSA